MILFSFERSCLETVLIITHLLNQGAFAKLPKKRRDRDFHRRRALSSNSQYHWGMYRKLNYASREERSLKSQYYCKLI